MKFIKRLKRRLSVFLFVHGWGKLSREYEQISDAAFRAEFLARNFGKDGFEIVRDMRANILGTYQK